MYKAEIIPYSLEFIKPAKTSRNTLLGKELYMLRLSKRGVPATFGLGEISPFEGLSIDDGPGFLPKLNETVDALNEGISPDELELEQFPSIGFGLETALLDLENGGRMTIFKNSFQPGLAGIPVNGLIWMASPDDMLKQVEEKVHSGFKCIKMKIGALDFDAECRMLEIIRKKYSAFQIELRVDANGAFPEADALGMLKDLHRFELHSIEQPIKAGQWEMMQELCAKSLLPIALDEELLGVKESNIRKLSDFINPAYLIIKPGLLGGFKISNAWINAANSKNRRWWITSALESNIGLNAIAQFTSEFKIRMAQGLGTGLLYKNNIPSPLEMRSGYLHYDPEKKWQIPAFGRN